MSPGKAKLGVRGAPWCCCPAPSSLGGGGGGSAGWVVVGMKIPPGRICSPPSLRCKCCRFLTSSWVWGWKWTFWWLKALSPVLMGPPTGLRAVRGWWQLTARSSTAGDCADPCCVLGDLWVFDAIFLQNWRCLFPRGWGGGEGISFCFHPCSFARGSRVA